ncbi:hypothetical protein HDU85_006308 [Gaertneriomyces sp. JEL0708]|nr:hypothetical protein HDU85_006308 [Gaertneriomyces sp. JEL0708]
MSKVSRSFVVGMTFGFALEKAKVHLPATIVKQMLVRDFTMMEMFLSAAAGGVLVMSFLESLGYFKRAPKTSVGIGKSKYAGNLLGGIILGAGMGLGGACPGTVLAQVGAGVVNAPWALFGAVGAAVTYGYVLRAIQGRYPKFLVSQPTATVDKQLNIPYTALALGFSVVCGGAIYLLESTRALWSSAAASASLSTVPNPFRMTWHPILGGVAVALAQTISLLLTKSPLGVSSGFAQLGASVVTKVDRKWRDHAPYYANYVASTDSMILATGIITGALASVTLGGRTPLADIAVGSKYTSMAAGALLITGARMAGGCTSGHGISGMAQLSPASFVTVAGMFAGGIAMAFFSGRWLWV